MCFSVGHYPTWWLWLYGQGRSGNKCQHSENSHWLFTLFSFRLSSPTLPPWLAVLITKLQLQLVTQNTVTTTGQAPGQACYADIVSVNNYHHWQHFLIMFNIGITHLCQTSLCWQPAHVWVCTLYYCTLLIYVTIYTQYLYRDRKYNPACLYLWQ